MGWLQRTFRLEQRGTSVRREVLGGAVTFFAMAYIIVVNPAILAAAGIPVGPSTTATVVVAIVGTLLMAFVANRPIGVAPYMGENAFVAFTVVGLLGFAWQTAIGAVFVTGIAFALLTAIGVRGRVANALPASLKHSFAAGIGLFLAFIGLYETGLVTSAAAGMPADALLVPGKGVLAAPAVPVRLGDVADPRVLLAIGNVLVISVLSALRVRGAILVGIVSTGALGIVLGLAERPERVFALPFTGDYSLAPIAFELDLAGVFSLAFVPVLVTIFLMDFLDTIGTLMGVAAAGEMLDDEGQFEEIGRPMMADAAASVTAGLVGTTTAGAYIESATGIEEGARTGLAALVTASCFALSLFVLPLFGPIQTLSFAYGPALVFVGILMLRSVARIDLADPTELVPAATTILMIAFTYNIGNGLTAGLIVHAVMKLATGRARELDAWVGALAALSLLYYVAGIAH